MSSFINMIKTMAGETSLTFDQLPGVMPYYLRAATTLSGGLDANQTIPRIEARISGLSVRAEHLARYRKVCGFARSSTLPITYPHVLAFPIHMAVLTHKTFPLKLLGLVHVKNQISQQRPVGVDEPLDLLIYVDGHRETAKGIEFELTTEAYAGDQTAVWQANATFLSRQKTNVPKESGKKHDGPPKLDFTPETQGEWTVPADIGRHYAAAAGDYNPIHLSPYSAKLFGFKRAIAHGMWTKARAAAALHDHIGDGPATIDVAFKKPVFLPSRATFCHGQTSQNRAFALTDKSGDIHHLTGTLSHS